MACVDMNGTGGLAIIFWNALHQDEELQLKLVGEAPSWARRGEGGVAFGTVMLVLGYLEG
ncbi:hypothetical protein CK203_018794 [Vitis vinifera]|uniref:Uncharacterized protein n=1 Tax=Vitis vinifera TaxID=29760 RepID=A0A438JAM3_VITVI|nr:hypothetical protein CK203_018794 [Vitis vinifera]